MNDIQLKNEAICWLHQNAKDHMTFPLEYGAQEVAIGIHGFAGRIGHVAESIVRELKARGHNVTYEKSNRVRKFVFREAKNSPI